MQATGIQLLCKERGWSRSRLVLELRRVAGQRGAVLPADESLKRMIRQWINGDRGLSEFYAELFTAVFGVPFETVKEESADGAGVLVERLLWAGALDGELVTLFAQQNQSLRLLDRRLGARRLLAQTESHVQQMAELLAFALCGPHRESLAEVLAAAASLAGWQALDLGRPDRAWREYETAKAAARESNCLAVLAHVSAEQAYALLDLGRAEDALEQVKYARQRAKGQVPAVLETWLWAAQAEMHAAVGDENATRRALDHAEKYLVQGDDGTLPSVVLDEVHLARWRGNCLARLGAAEAVDDLTAALARLDPAFTRARAGVHCDLAVAFNARGEPDAVHEHAQRAAELADATTSVRQQRRISALLNAS